MKFRPFFGWFLSAVVKMNWNAKLFCAIFMTTKVRDVKLQYKYFLCYKILMKYASIREFSYSYQSSPTEGNIWNWLKNIIKLIVLLDLYLYIYICYEPYKKNQHDCSCKFTVLAHTTLLHNLVDGRNRFKPPKKSKSTSKIKVKFKYLHGALGIYISKGSLLHFILASFFWVLFDFLDAGYLRWQNSILIFRGT